MEIACWDSADFVCLTFCFAWLNTGKKTNQSNANKTKKQLPKNFKIQRVGKTLSFGSWKFASYLNLSEASRGGRT